MIRLNTLLIQASLLLGLACSCLAAEVYADSKEEAAALLDTLQDNLPNQAIEFEARLETLNRQGDVRHVHNLDVAFDFSGALPSADFVLRDRFGDFLKGAQLDWSDPSAPPSFLLQQNESAAFEEIEKVAESIEDTELTWLDISFQYLWWEPTGIAGYSKILSRDCVAVDVQAPDAQGPYSGARLWIDPEMGGLLEAEFYSHGDKQIKKLKIKSLRKIDDLWFPKEIEVINSKNRRRTRMMTYTDSFSASASDDEE